MSGLTGSAIGEQAGAIDLDRHLGDHFLDELQFAKAAAESLSFFCVSNGMVKARLSKSEGTGRQEQARGLIALMQDPAAAADFANDGLRRQLAFIKI